MKRNFLFLSFLFLTSSFVNLSSLEAKGGEGMAYYKAGFPQVAKPILLDELTTDAATKGQTCFFLGQIYFGESKPDSALIYFNKGLAADPTYSMNTIGLAMLKIKSNPVVAANEIESVLKEKANKKNVDLFIEASRAYLSNNIIDIAMAYQEKAKQIKSKYAPVSVLLGDIELAKENTGGACSNYEVAILYDKSCKEAYIKYARAYKNVNSALSIEKLNILKQIEPDFLLVDRELADIYYSINDFNKAAALYESYLKSGNSNVQDLTKYAMTLFLNQNLEKALDVVKLGLQKAPRNPAFNRLNMWINVDLKRDQEALNAADVFFNKTDNPDFTYLDYRYYGQALRDTKQIDSAIVQYKKGLGLDSTKVELWKDISDMYTDKKDYKNAVSAYNIYFNSLNDDKKNADALLPLGKLNYSLGNDTAAILSEKKEALLKADTIFAKVATLDPTNYRGNFYRARTNSSLDPDAAQGLAKPYYDLTATLIESKTDAIRYKGILIECYSYLGFYYLQKDDNLNSLLYWNKILVLDPTNGPANKAKTGIEKFLKTKK
jgi:tetratricopeptide (TPR) repeat protein